MKNLFNNIFLKLFNKNNKKPQKHEKPTEKSLFIKQNCCDWAR